jgi:quercetin 2,3-dioxygenase
MIYLCKATERCRSKTTWLDSWHTFSFGEYYNPHHMGFGFLRVINDDIIAPKSGFSEHPHRNMEIITYVLNGSLEHQDSMGNGSIIQQGEVQIMSAGSGVTHSEENPSPTNSVHLLQIWILPNQLNTTPSYAQALFDTSQKDGKLCLIVSPNKESGSLGIHQNTRIFSALLNTTQHIQHAIKRGNSVFIHVAKG